MRNPMSIDTTEIKLSIIGKPNSGKSTLFNCFFGKEISPVGNEYGLTKNLFRDKFKFKNKQFVIVDTPGLRRRTKVIEKNEKKRNSEVIKLIENVDIIILLIDSLENISKQDFRLADLALNKNKILFFLFNKIDVVEDFKKFKSKTRNFLKENYNKYKLINFEFISAKKNLRVNKVLEEIIIKKKLSETRIKKQKFNSFISYLNKKGTYPRVNNIDIKPKYIVQISGELPKFKVFINSKKRTPQIFQKYFDNNFREYFKLIGVPIIYEFKSSKNPYAS